MRDNSNTSYWLKGTLHHPEYTNKSLNERIEIGGPFKENEILIDEYTSINNILNKLTTKLNKLDLPIFKIIPLKNSLNAEETPENDRKYFIITNNNVQNNYFTKEVPLNIINTFSLELEHLEDFKKSIQKFLNTNGVIESHITQILFNPIDLQFKFKSDSDKLLTKIICDYLPNLKNIDKKVENYEDREHIYKEKCAFMIALILEHILISVLKKKIDTPEYKEDRRSKKYSYDILNKLLIKYKITSIPFRYNEGNLILQNNKDSDLLNKLIEELSFFDKEFPSVRAIRTYNNIYEILNDFFTKYEENDTKYFSIRTLEDVFYLDKFKYKQSTISKILNSSSFNDYDELYNVLTKVACIRAVESQSGGKSKKSKRRSSKSNKKHKKTIKKNLKKL
jgi:hypothetical protein